jgi:predicted DNA-binding transcriptional regulator AlpA
MQQDDDEFLPTRRVRARYGGKSEKTIDRWIEAGVLPPPVWINGRRHWRRSALERHEREGMSRRKPETVGD